MFLSYGVVQQVASPGFQPNNWFTAMFYLIMLVGATVGGRSIVWLKTRLAEKLGVAPRLDKQS